MSREAVLIVFFFSLDQRTKDYYFVSSAAPILTFVIIYWYLIRLVLPHYMIYKKPYSLKKFVRYYNIFQILINARIVYGLIKCGWFTGRFGLTCVVVDPLSTDPLDLEVVHFILPTRVEI